MTMDLYDVMRTTAAIREYEDRDVPNDVLHRVLDGARFAPSGGNRQGWRVIVVRDRAVKRRLRDLYREPWQAYIGKRDPGRDHRMRVMNRFVECLDDIPVILTFWADMPTIEFTDRDLDRPSVVGGGSVWPLVQNVALACRREGLGTAITTLLVRQEPEVRALLQAPDEFGLVCVMTLGYPRRFASRLRRKPVSEFAYLERFGGEPVSPH
ncbi:MAG: nitroreductase family protein [Chloroflexi bacterium]|nr:MAG: nitroreductase family protein [Chloroflexota bacterium]